MVDEAIYGIRKDSTPDILNFFYGRDYNVVNTDSSLILFLPRRGGQAPHATGAAPAAQRLTQLKPEALIQPKVRKAFPDTTFWSADVNTDANGQAGVNFDFPDSLTTWRATARGVTADTRVAARRFRKSSCARTSSCGWPCRDSSPWAMR